MARKRHIFKTGEQNPRWSGGSVDLICQGCQVGFTRNVMKRKAKFCSIACSVRNLHRPEIIAKRAATATGTTRENTNHKKGEDSPNWVGDKISYLGLHIWLVKNFGNPKECVDCHKSGEKVKGMWNIHWSNKRGLYIRDVKQFEGRCPSCHKIYDLVKIEQQYVT